MVRPTGRILSRPVTNLRPLPKKGKGSPAGKPTADMAADEAATRDAQPLLTRCGLCRWWFAGTAGEGRLEALAHRKKKHPEVANQKRKRRRTGGTFSTPSVEARAQAQRNLAAQRKAAE